MAITVNGKNVSGGLPGKSTYQMAVAGGLSMTEQEFNAALVNVGDIGAVLDAINGEEV